MIGERFDTCPRVRPSKYVGVFVVIDTAFYVFSLKNIFSHTQSKFFQTSGSGNKRASDKHRLKCFPVTNEEIKSGIAGSKQGKQIKDNNANAQNANKGKVGKVEKAIEKTKNNIRVQSFRILLKQPEKLLPDMNV